MIRQFVLAATLAGCLAACPSAQADQQAYGRSWGGGNSSINWSRFYHYPYVYYPQNFWGPEYYSSSDSLYHRYPPEMQIPVYNKKWYNAYPRHRRFHSGHHFILDAF